MKTAKKVLGGKYMVKYNNGILYEGDIVYLIKSESPSDDSSWFSPHKEASFDDLCTVSSSMESVELIEEPQPDFDKLPIGTKLWDKETGREIQILGYYVYKISFNETADMDYLKREFSLTPPETITINGKKYKVTEELNKILDELEEVVDETIQST